MLTLIVSYLRNFSCPKKKSVDSFINTSTGIGNFSEAIESHYFCKIRFNFITPSMPKSSEVYVFHVLHLQLYI